MSLQRQLLFILPLGLAGWLAYVTSLAAPPEAASENAVRAVLLFNLLQFAELPADGPEPKALTICVASSDPERLAAMAQLQDRQVRGRALLVRSDKEENRCAAIYVDSRVHWQAMADRNDIQRALTVGAYPGFIQDGGIVELDFRQSRTRFDINLAQARRAGIRLYPQLLRLARQIIE